MEFTSNFPPDKRSNQAQERQQNTSRNFNGIQWPATSNNVSCQPPNQQARNEHE
ncbi:hypothetical protein Hsw_1491 [Hymenobacter swuensis DY53]|uniref:Uncharacterized protein n=1 Tax=Hymenobacter swuensis DY53 TaxID=1227739 RepID=W8F3C1_9BACT|nr:hypothetical protein Hsw_1491 [Hymenobacter swuensis DY53]